MASVGEVWRVALSAMLGKPIDSKHVWYGMLNAPFPIKGSWNHILMAAICGYKWIPDEVINGKSVREYILWYLRFPFMGDEDLSRIYVEWHLIPVLCIRAIAWKRGDDEVFEACGDWLQAFAGFAALSSWPAAGNYLDVADGKIKPSRGWCCTFAGSRSWSHHSGTLIEKDGRFYLKDGTKLRDITYAHKNGLKSIHHLERHTLDEVVQRMLTLSPFGYPQRNNNDGRCGEEAFEMVGSDPLRFWGISGGQADACRKFVKGDVSQQGAVLAMVEGHEPVDPYLFLRGTRGVATVHEQESKSVSTSSLFALIYSVGSVLLDGRHLRAVTWADSARQRPTRGKARYLWDRGVVEMRTMAGEWGEENKARKSLGYRYGINVGRDEPLQIGELISAVRVGPAGIEELDPATGLPPTEDSPPTEEPPVEEEPPEDGGVPVRPQPERKPFWQKPVVILVVIAAVVLFATVGPCS